MDSQLGTAGEPREARPAQPPSEGPPSSPWASPDSVPVPATPPAAPSRPDSPAASWGAGAWSADSTWTAEPPAPPYPGSSSPWSPPPGEPSPWSPPPGAPPVSPRAGHPPPPPPGPLRNPAPAAAGPGDRLTAPLPYLPPGPLPYHPEPPRGYRETRPLRFGAAAAGCGAGVIWFLLLALVAWSPLSAVLITLAGVLAAVGAVAVLTWRGDRGAAAGLAVAAALAVAVFTLATWF